MTRRQSSAIFKNSLDPFPVRQLRLFAATANSFVKVLRGFNGIVTYNHTMVLSFFSKISTWIQRIFLETFSTFLEKVQKSVFVSLGYMFPCTVRPFHHPLAITSVHTTRPIWERNKLCIAKKVVAKYRIRHSTVHKYDLRVQSIHQRVKSSFVFVLVFTVANTAIRAKAHNTVLRNTKKSNAFWKVPGRIGQLVTPANQRINIAAIALVIAAKRSATVEICYLNSRWCVDREQSTGSRKRNLLKSST